MRRAFLHFTESRAAALPLPCYKFGWKGPVPGQSRVWLGPLLMNFTERTDKQRKPIKMNVILFSNEAKNDPEWNPADARSHAGEGGTLGHNCVTAPSRQGGMAAASGGVYTNRHS
jgi:hypothetical protein